VSTSAHRDQHVLCAREVDRTFDIRGVGAAHNETWAPVELGVPDPPRRLVLAVRGAEERAVKTRREVPDHALLDRVHVSTRLSDLAGVRGIEESEPTNRDGLTACLVIGPRSLRNR